ncbi:MAG TPA: hypothetical protein PKA88_22575, partial [Polyangiaceae bacterium]|nr:hypothetical protein [Polyangiaceae bacterium]
MTEDNTTLCAKVEDHLSDILDGTASDELYDHVADCDRCRDVRFEAERLTGLVAAAGADYVPQDDLESRVLAELERRGGAASDSLEHSGAGLPASVPTTPSATPAASAEAPSGDADAKPAESLASGDATSGEPDSVDAPMSSPPVTARMDFVKSAITADRHDTLKSEGPKPRATEAPTEEMPATPEVMPSATPEAAADARQDPAGSGGKIDERPRLVATRSRGKRALLAGGGLAGLAAMAAAGVLLLRSGGGPLGGTSGDGWSGKVSHVVSASGEKGGLST